MHLREHQQAVGEYDKLAGNSDSGVCRDTSGQFPHMSVFGECKRGIAGKRAPTEGDP